MAIIVPTCAGKTTLVLKTAAAIAASGQSVAALAFFPEWRAQAASFMTAAEELGVSAAIVSSAEAWQRTLRNFKSCDALVVDTPCFVSHPDTPRRLLGLRELGDARSVLHYALCLHHGRDFLLRELHLALAYGIDFLALPQADLAPGLGVLLDLELHAPRPISIVNATAALDTPLVSFGAAAVLSTLGFASAD